MKVVEHWERSPGHAVERDGVVGVTKRLLIGPDDGAPHFALRVFQVEPSGHTPLHQHDFEHEVVVLRGSGTLRGATGDRALEPGAVVLIEPGELHQFRAAEAEELVFVCVVPKEYA